VNRELLRLKKMLLESNVPTREESLAKVFDILNNYELEFEEAFDKFQYELSNFMINKRCYK
jgi:hypothetical protein